MMDFLLYADFQQIYAIWLWDNAHWAHGENINITMLAVDREVRRKPG